MILKQVLLIRQVAGLAGQQEYEQETNNLKHIFILIFSLIVLASCENSESNIRNFINTENLAIEQLTDSEIIYTENGNLKVKVMSQKMERFSDKEEIKTTNHENKDVEESEVFESQGTKENFEIKEPEMFESSDLEDDLEIPAFLRRQKN